ncbi:MAG: hypothetical protein HZB91_12905 [Elusimicrobia bacterium]|nr:hypothetical protein [Elusimicrobiota bacterium]
MKCARCGTEQPDDLQVCARCGHVLKEEGGPSFQLPSAPAEATGQQVGKIILPEGFAPKPPAPGGAPPPGQGAPPAAPVFPATQDKKPPEPTPKPGRPAPGEFDMEVIERPKSDPKTPILLGIVLLGFGGYFAFRPPKMEAPPPPPVQTAPSTAAVKPPPDPKVESCKQGLVDQGFLLVEAEAYCLGTPETWARVKQLQEARVASISFAEVNTVMDVQIVPIKGALTPEGRIRVYLYLILSDAQNRPCAVLSGSVVVTTEISPVLRFPDKPISRERFRRATLPVHNQPTVHAFLGVMEFDSQAVAGQMMTVSLQFDGDRLDHQAVVTF